MSLSWNNYKILSKVYVVVLWKFPSFYLIIKCFKPTALMVDLKFYNINNFVLFLLIRYATTIYREIIW